MSAPPGDPHDAVLLQRLRERPAATGGGRGPGADLEQRLAATALPAPVVELIRTVVGRTRLWRGERADVGEELIAHFDDGLAAGVTADRLIADFGDLDAAARLIRRAARRNRPLAWQTLRVARAAAVVIVVLYVALVVRYMLVRPSPVDHRPLLNEVAAAVPEADRAWPAYRAALIDIDADRAAIDAITLHTPGPADDGWDAAVAALDRLAAPLAAVREAARRPGLGLVVGYGLAPEDRILWPDSSPGFSAPADEALIGVLIPHLGTMRMLAKILAMDARRAAAAGDGATAVADLATIVRVARHLRETPILVADLVANAITALAVDRTREIVTTTPDVFTDTQLAELSAVLGSADEIFTIRVSGERLVFHDLVARMYTDDGAGDGRLTNDGLRLLDALRGAPGQEPGDRGSWLGPVAMPAVSMITISRRELLAEYDAAMDAHERQSGRPLWMQERADLDERMYRWSADPITRLRYRPLILLTPALAHAGSMGELGRARRDGALVGIALERHRRIYDTWPARLEDLAAGLLPAVPLDRFIGLPLRYVLTDAGPIVYSVGTDRDDDGGVTPPGTADAAARWLPASSLMSRAPESIPDGDWVLWSTP